MKHSVVIALGLCALLGAVEAQAQTATHLSIDEAVSRGIQASHRLAQLEARRTSAVAAVDERRASERPAVSLQAGYTRTNHVDSFALPDPSAGGRPVVLYSDVPDNLRTRIDLQWPIYTGGKTNALERAARTHADALGHDRQAAQADLTLEIRRACWSVVTAGAAVRVLDQALTRINAHLADARQRLQAGLVPPTDVLSSEAQQSRQQMLLIEARNLEEIARADLRRLVGLPADAAIEVDAMLEPPPAPDLAPTALVGQARAARPERRALETRLQGADYMKNAARAGRLPWVAIGAGYDYARPNPRVYPRTAEWKTSWDLGFNVNWSLWDSGRAKAEMAQAVANRREIEEGLLEFDAVLESDVRQQRLTLESALAAITAADGAVRSAGEARRVVAERYAAGVATNIDALDAQLGLMQAELDRTRTIANARLAAARLDRVLGR
ncbi:MAG: TolC family protein [Acidobacteriota bacterium]